MKVLITGGAGYIGSTIASACLDEGIVPVILDDLSTGLEAFTEGRHFYEGDIADGVLIDRIFADHPEIEAVVHCAAKIVVSESVSEPLAYYENNVAKSVALLASLARHGVDRFVFSSTASLYLPGPDFEVDESSAIQPESPYAASKMFVERVLQDFAATGGMRVAALRYFNPIGADPQLRTGMQHLLPSHLLGKLVEARTSNTPFTVTGTDWDTRDGSGLRDFIHVWDLAAAHVRVLQQFDRILSAGGESAENDGSSSTGYQVINLGTGRGTTVLEFVDAFEQATGEKLDVRHAAPRPGDVVGSYTRVEKARRLLGWSAARSIADGAVDSLKWRELLPAVLLRESELRTRHPEEQR